MLKLPMKRLIIFMLFFTLALASASYCQDSGEERIIKHTTGKVSGVDWVADKLVVKTYDYGSLDEMVFIVSDNTPVTKGVKDSSLASINIEDRVSIDYYSSFAGMKAIRIVVQQ